MPASAVGAGTYQDAEKHQKAVGATHDDGFGISRGGAVDTGGC